MFRNALATIARALGVSTDTRTAYRAQTGHMVALVSHRPHDGDFWTRVGGEKVVTRTRVGMVAELAARGYVAQFI